MHLSLTPRCSSWTLLLLLVSSLLLEGNMASARKGRLLNVPNNKSFGDMLEKAIKSSQKMNGLIFYLCDHLDIYYVKGYGFNQRTTRCHTSSLSSPQTKEQAQKIQSDVLLKFAYSLLKAWVNPLNHLWGEMHIRLGSTPPTLTRALELKTENKNILDTMKKIALKGNFVIGENENSPAWTDLGYLQSADRNTKYFAFYNMFHCLKRDSQNVEMYLKLLKCRLTHSNC
ncbi:prolactin-4A1-like [Meriones unguiculatus]|uniref:prolactin-4A1-like n=1 Tax=Meriones unguiculatus TaxID=10047 RepID=UPI000B4FC563|nr:prolactin-4A1-like [Meriones unguiculatus]